MALFHRRTKSMFFLALVISTVNISAQQSWVKTLPGIGSFSSPRVADLNGDGQDEVVLPINTQVMNELQAKFFHNNIVAIEFTEKIAVELGLQNEGSSISSTPWIGDMDNNGFLDIIYIHGTNPKQTYTFDGMRISRIDTTIPLSGKIRWGSYMGSNHNGVYDK